MKDIKPGDFVKVSAPFQAHGEVKELVWIDKEFGNVWAIELYHGYSGGYKPYIIEVTEDFLSLS